RARQSLPVVPPPVRSVACEHRAPKPSDAPHRGKRDRPACTNAGLHVLLRLEPKAIARSDIRRVLAARDPRLRYYLQPRSQQGLSRLVQQKNTFVALSSE